MSGIASNIDVKRSWDSDRESKSHVEKEMSMLSPEKRMKRNSSSVKLGNEESAVFEFPTTSMSSNGMNNVHGLLDYGISSSSSSMGPPEMMDRIPRTPIDVDGHNSPKTPKSADVRMLTDALISPLNVANSPTATIRRSGIANVPSSKDWGSPLGKEFTNVGEGFCFSDAVQRSRSPINIDHNHHKKSSVLPHHKSSSQSGGPGRSHGRDGGEGPDDGLGGIGGGAHGQKGDPGMQGMGRYQSGEGEGGQHHYRPSSSSSSSHHHVNVGNASKTTTSNSHGALHVDTTGTELDSSSSRRGPQTSGSRGMNRGTMGESDMLLSPTSTEFMTEFEGLASPMMVGLDHDSQDHFMSNKQALAARLGGGHMTAGGGGGWGSWSNSAGIDSPGLAAITAAAELHGLGSIDDMPSDGSDHHRTTHGNSSGTGGYYHSNKIDVDRGPASSHSPKIHRHKNGLGQGDDRGNHQYHGGMGRGSGEGGIHGDGMTMSMAPTTNLFGMMGGGEYSPGGGEDGLLLDIDEEGFHQQIAHAGRQGFATSAFGAFSQMSPYSALHRRKRTSPGQEDENDHGEIGGTNNVRGQSVLGNSWESGMTAASGGVASRSSGNDSELDEGGDRDGGGGLGGGVAKGGTGQGARGRSVKFGKNQSGQQKELGLGPPLPSRGGTKRRSNSADSADYSGDSGVEAECRTSESMYLLMKAAGSISSSGDSSIDANRTSSSGTKGGKGGGRGRKARGSSIDDGDDGEGAVSSTLTDTKKSHHHRRGSGGESLSLSDKASVNVGSSSRRGSTGSSALSSSGPHGAGAPSWGGGSGGGDVLTPAAAVAIQSHSSKPIICNCKRSRCLKLYCDCFRFSKFCDMCNCMDCANMGTREDERLAAIAAITDRNPEAFKPILSTEGDPGGSESSSALHKSGCNCKKSQCLKKYCECFTALVPCSDRCKCLECKNTTDLYAHSMKTDGSARGDPSLLKPSSTAKQLSAASSSSSSGVGGSGGGANSKVRGGRGAAASHHLRSSGSEDDAGYARPYSYNVSAGANASVYSSLHAQQATATAGAGSYSGGGAIGLRSPALLAGSRSGTRANSLLSAHMNMSSSGGATASSSREQHHHRYGDNNMGGDDGDMDGSDPANALSETKRRSGSVGSGSESMATGTGTTGTEPGDSVGSRLIRNLSLMQGLDVQGQGLAAGGGGGLEKEYGGDDMNRHHGSTADSSSSSSSSHPYGNSKLSGSASSSSGGLHTPPRLRTSMSIGSIESSSGGNVMHQHQGGGSSSSSNTGAISVSSPIGLLAVLCEQRRDEELSRSTHTTSSSPRANILDIYEKNIAHTGGSGSSSGGIDGPEGKGPAPALNPLPALAKTSSGGSKSSSGSSGAGGGGSGVTRGGTSRGGRSRSGGGSTGTGLESAGEVGSAGMAEGAGEVSMSMTKMDDVDSSSSSSSQRKAAQQAAGADIAPPAAAAGAVTKEPRRTSRGGGKSK